MWNDTCKSCQKAASGLAGATWGTCTGNPCEGYEKDGTILFGVQASIFPTIWEFVALSGDANEPERMLVPYIESETGHSIDIETVLKFYKKKYISQEMFETKLEQLLDAEMHSPKVTAD